MAYARTTSVDGWWVSLPLARVTRLDGPTADLIALSLEPLPDSAPAVVSCHPGRDTSLKEQVGQFLNELERVAVDLFPLWLPGASDIAGPQGAGIPAARALAFELAAASHHFGPFIASLAERSLTGAAPRATFSAEVRANGLARVIAASYGRETSALLVDVPDDLTAQAEHTLISSLEWIAHSGGFAVWLTGARLRAVDRVDTEVVVLPPAVAVLAHEVRRDAEPPEPPAAPGQPGQPGQAGPTMTYPPPTGVPHPGSTVERALEAALAIRPWASGRAWNQTYRSHALAETYRLDLLWAAERLVVEIDGPDHCGVAKYAADRRRDVQLALDGYTVVRFTNAQVLHDAGTVTSQLERLIRNRRPPNLENHAHG